MSVTQAQANFINASHFAVIGRVLSDRSRWDNKVLRWYQDRNLPVTPVLPNQASTNSDNQIEGLSVLDDPMKLENLENTSISIIINPAIGLGILKSLYPPSSQPSPAPNPDIKGEPASTSSSQGQRQTRSQTQSQTQQTRERDVMKGPRGVWFQPGAESPEIISYIKEMGLEKRVIWGGACILEDGDYVMKKRAKL